MVRDILEYSDDELVREYRTKLLRVADWAAVNYLSEMDRRASLKQAEAAERQSQELVALTRDIRDLTVRLASYTLAIRWLTVAVVVLGVVAAVPVISDIIHSLSGA